MFRVAAICLILAVFLVGCESDGPAMVTGEAVGTRTVIVDGTEYTVPNYAFLNERFEFKRIVEGEEESRSYVFRHFSEAVSHEKCCTMLTYGKNLREHEVSIPTYSEVLYVGPPLTLPDNHAHTIAIETNNDFLGSVSDQIDEIDWQQIDGSSSFEVANDGHSLTFSAPTLKEIERWVFRVEITTEQGRVFTKDKVVFVVPQGDWLDVSQIYAGANFNASIVLRENNTFYHETSGMPNFSEPLDRPVKLLASLGGSAFVVTDDNQLTTYRRGRVTPVEQDFGSVTQLLGVFSVRSTMLVVNEEGEVFSSFSGYEVRVNDAVSMAPSLFEGPYLNTKGVLVDQEGETIAESVKQLSATAYLSESGNKNAVELSVLNQFVFALRPNGEVISTTRLPPSLNKITAVDAGSPTHLALSENGWVYRWGRGSAGVSEDVFNGLSPNPMNLTQEAYERFNGAGE